MTRKQTKSILEEIKNCPERTEKDRIEDFQNYFIKIIKFPKCTQNSCAFIGETEIDKIQLTQDILLSNGFKEWDGKTGDFIFIDAEKKFKSYKVMLDVLKKYKDVKFVVIINCSNVLRNDDKILIFKYLNEHEREIYAEGNPKYQYRVAAHYIFLCDSNPMSKLKIQEHGNSFRECVEWVY